MEAFGSWANGRVFGWIGRQGGQQGNLEIEAIIIARMPRRPAPGRTAARDPDPTHDEAGRPSKTQRKKESADLQDLGLELTRLPTSVVTTLVLPDSLRDALAEYARTRSHEGRRRQLQFIGKLMRQVDPEPLREAVAQAQLGTARDALRLHEAEQWRASLMEDDDALTRWATEVPGCDLQQLRTLVRNARSQSQGDAARGEAVRQGRA